MVKHQRFASKGVWAQRAARQSMKLRMQNQRCTILEAQYSVQLRLSQEKIKLEVAAGSSRLLPVRAAQLQREADLKTAELAASRNITSVFDERTKHLHVYGEPATVVVVENFLDTQKRIYTVEFSKCSKCNSELMFNQTTHQLTCSFCKFCFTSMFVSRDYSEDAVANSRYMKAALNTSPEPNSSVVENHAARVLQYQKWLQQFASDAPPTPPQVLALLYRELAHVHVVSSTRCRPTPVAAILRAHGFREEAACAVRITMECNGLEPPQLDPHLIRNMVQRFEELTYLEARHPQHRKMYTFEFLSAVIFWAEGRSDLLPLIFVHKSRDIIKLCDDRVRSIVRDLQTTSQLDWSLLLQLTFDQS